MLALTYRRFEAIRQKLRCKHLLNPLNAELNPIRHLLALVGARHIVHVSRVRVKTPSVKWRKGLVKRSLNRKTL
jgi:hypothetical protein